jgi:hypothetical protein
MATANEARPRDRHDRILLRVTILSVFIAACAVVLTSYQIWTVRDNAKRQLRAYAMVESSVIGVDSNNKLNVSITVKNFGLTPTYDFRHWACAVVRDTPDRDGDFRTASAITVREAPKSLIAPSATIGKIYSGSCDHGETAISVDERAAIKSGKKAVFAIGVIKYRDIFHAEHVTQYRRAWDDVHNGIDGYGGNYADEGCPWSGR